MRGQLDLNFHVSLECHSIEPDSAHSIELIDSSESSESQVNEGCSSHDRVVFQTFRMGCKVPNTA